MAWLGSRVRLAAPVAYFQWVGDFFFSLPLVRYGLFLVPRRYLYVYFCYEIFVLGVRIDEIIVVAKINRISRSCSILKGAFLQVFA